MTRKTRDVIYNIANNIYNQIQSIDAQEIELYKELNNLKTQVKFINRKIDALEQDKRRKKKKMRKYKITIEDTETGKANTYNSDIIWAVLHGEDENGKTCTTTLSLYEANTIDLAFSALKLHSLADREYNENVTNWEFGKILEMTEKERDNDG